MARKNEPYIYQVLRSLATIMCDSRDLGILIGYSLRCIYYEDCNITSLNR